MCSYEREGSLGFWDLRFSNQDLGKWARKFCHVNTSAQFLGWKWGRTCLDGIILLWMLYFPNHKHPILITAVIQSSIKVANDRRESYNFVFHHVCFSFSNFAPQLIRRIFSLISSQKRGWNFSYQPKVKLLVPVARPAKSTGLMWRSPKSRCVKNLTLQKTPCGLNQESNHLP